MTTTRKRAQRQPIQVSPEPWEGSWHLDKRVPVALIVTMFMQLAAGLWWASQINAEVQFVKLQIAQLQNDLKDKNDKFEKVSELVVQMSALTASILKVEKTVETLRDRVFADNFSRKTK